MEERLAPLCLLPPPSGTPWSGARPQSPATDIIGSGGVTLRLELPLFWYAPRWHRLPLEMADPLALGVTARGLAVAALRSELSSSDHEPLLCHGGGDQPPPPRIVPYRPERYGLTVRDFDDAAIVDVRLTLIRDETGRFAYPPEQIARWESTPGDRPLAGGGWVPAATFPPDVPGLEHLGRKLDQIRGLAPSAAVFLSVIPCRIDDELPRLLAANPDGIVMRLDPFHLDGLQLASFTRRARRLLVRHGAESLPLWIVPGPVSPCDAVKLIALGASAVAVDAWCAPLRQRAADLRPKTSFQYTLGPEVIAARMEELLDAQLAEPLRQFTGWYLSLDRDAAWETLGSFSATWSKTLGVRPLG